MNTNTNTNTNTANLDTDLDTNTDTNTNLTKFLEIALGAALRAAQASVMNMRHGAVLIQNRKVLFSRPNTSQKVIVDRFMNVPSLHAEAAVLQRVLCS